MPIIDAQRMIRIDSGLVDSHGNETTLGEAYEKINEFIEENMKDEDRNACKDHVYPFLASLTSTIVRGMYGDEGAAMILAASPFTRTLMVHSIMCGFYIYHLMQEKTLIFNTVEEELTEEQLHDIRTRQGIVEATLTAIMMGLNPAEVFQELYKTGQLTDEDIEKYGLEELVQDVEPDTEESN